MKVTAMMEILQKVINTDPEIELEFWFDGGVSGTFMGLFEEFEYIGEEKILQLVFKDVQWPDRG